MWRQPFIRATSFFYAAGNLTVSSYLFVLVVIARRGGLSGGEVGILLALVSVAILGGSVLGGRVRRRLDVRAVVLCEAYTGLALVAFVAWPNVWVFLAALLPHAFVLPVTDSYVIAHRIAATPEHLLGRTEAARRLIATTASPLGPLVAGILLSVSSARVTVACLVAITAAIAVYVTGAAALREPPPLV